MLKGKTIVSQLNEGTYNDYSQDKPSSLLSSKKCIPLSDVCGNNEVDKIPNLFVEIEYINTTKNLRYSIDVLKQKLPGYNNLYYIEIFDLLETLDFNLNEVNLYLNLQKLIPLGNNIQSQISKLNSLLDVIPRNSFKRIKEDTDKKIGFFTNNDELIARFGVFNEDVSVYYGNLYDEIQKLKSMDFKKYDLIDLYLGFFNFISDELVDKNLMNLSDISNSIIASRVVSLNNSKVVLNQFKQLLKIELSSRDIELNNLKEYLDILKPSLYLLQNQNFSDFKKQFKQLLDR